MRRSALSLVAFVAIAVPAAALHAAQSYPERPVRIVAGTAAGGQSDRIARLVAQGLEKIWGGARIDMVFGDASRSAATSSGSPTS